jgi:hypothetical protein
MGWDVDLERESERTSHDGQWYVGRFWCGDEFYELYENTIGENEYDYSIHRHAKGDSIFFVNRSQYYFYNSYDNLTSKELMSKITRIIVNCLDGNDINEDFDWTDSVQSAKPTWEELEVGDTIIYQPKHFKEPRYYTFYGIQDDRLRFRQATDKRGILMNKISYNNLYRDGYIR